VRSLDWFLTKTGEQGSVPEAQATIVQTVEQSRNFYLDKAWNLPDGSTLKLYHRRTPVQVQTLTEFRVKTRSQDCSGKSHRNKPRLGTGASNIRVVWFREQLQSGLVLLNWRNKGGSGGGRLVTRPRHRQRSFVSQFPAPEQPAGRFEVTADGNAPSNVPSRLTPWRQPI